MPKLTLLALTFIALFATTASAKDKSVANKYPVILVINENGKVTEVNMPESVPVNIKTKAKDAFVGKMIGIKRQSGRAVAYQQKISISTKHLVDKSQITSR